MSTVIIHKILMDFIIWKIWRVAPKKSKSQDLGRFSVSLGINFSFNAGRLVFFWEGGWERGGGEKRGKPNCTNCVPTTGVFRKKPQGGGAFFQHFQLRLAEIKAPPTSVFFFLVK